MSEVLRNREIPRHLDDWSREGGHEWPYWHHQMWEYEGAHAPRQGKLRKGSPAGQQRKEVRSEESETQVITINNQRSTFPRGRSNLQPENAGCFCFPEIANSLIR